jgi:hypothetical protein
MKKKTRQEKMLTQKSYQNMRGNAAEMKWNRLSMANG